LTFSGQAHDDSKSRVIDVTGVNVCRPETPNVSALIICFLTFHSGLRDEDVEQVIVPKLIPFEECRAVTQYYILFKAITQE
jgi:hypothetical protein